MSTPPTPESMDRGGKGKTAIPEEKEDEPSLLPMTPESKQLAAVIATAVATAMAGKSASPDSSSSMVLMHSTASIFAVPAGTGGACGIGGAAADTGGTTRLSVAAGLAWGSH